MGCVLSFFLLSLTSSGSTCFSGSFASDSLSSSSLTVSLAAFLAAAPRLVLPVVLVSVSLAGVFGVVSFSFVLGVLAGCEEKRG